MLLMHALRLQDFGAFTYLLIYLQRSLLQTVDSDCTMHRAIVFFCAAFLCVINNNNNNNTLKLLWQLHIS